MPCWLAAGITCTAVNVPSPGQYKECGTVRVNEYSEDNGPSFGPGNISFPLHLALEFETDANDTQFQFGFSLTGSAVGAATLNAIHTGLISFDLAPGVTMDQPNGFLTTPGDYILPGEGSPVPEPSMFAAMAFGLAAIVGHRAWVRSRRS